MAITRPTLTDSTSPTTGDIVNAAFFTDLYDRIDALIGDWVAVTFAAGNFTGNGSQTWTLTSPDQVSLSYRIHNKSMLVIWALNTTTVGGTPNTQLRIAIPASKVATRQTNATHWYQDNGTAGVGLAQVSPSGTVIELYLMSLGNWAAATNTTASVGQIEFEIN